MWEMLIEWCAGVYGVTTRPRSVSLALFALGLFVVGLVLVARWGLPSLVVPVGLLALSVIAARQVAAAREELWRAACRELDERGQRPTPMLGRALAPTAASLARLALAVDHVRRSELVAARDLLPQIEPALLRAEEAQLLDAVRAVISAELGDEGRAARQAARALPTGSADLDVRLGRVLLSSAWDDRDKLGSIVGAWAAAGAQRGPLSKLSSLARMRLDAGEALTTEVDAVEAHELAEEARALGDDGLAAELDARARATAYR